MTSNLTLKRTVIAGQLCEDDYEVRYCGHYVGRIYRNATKPQWNSERWFWGNSRSGAPDDCGYAESLEAAKQAWLESWNRFEDPLIGLGWLRAKLAQQQV